ncbi:LUD domain-containing protein [Spirosoma taeanense]|uniref:LUD domain-containing protein n=1 Tax=Spirosoma taeanense TaxID=2735870 RepID=A0A6M5YAQ6_9BACT|nr:LUD domain-containing protein [Spirosoma taeanense]QJW90370.1 LUD domain-containing protein [Spirosoma taeanense]
MSSREKMLAAIARNKPNADLYPLPVLPLPHSFVDQGVERFCQVLQGIGGEVMRVTDMDAIRQYVETHYDHTHRIVTTLPELASVAELQWPNTPPHELANVELALLRGHFGVAENGSIWVTESLLEHRAAPYICQQLALIIRKADIVPTMHEAYARIGNETYGYGTFIAGPSKTADIEQSLVLGAHGPKGMIAFILD